MTAIARLTDVGKQYVKYEDVPTLVTGMRHMLRRGRRGRLWAVRHVDLELEPGQSVAIIGRNGSGKSTTLSMLAGVTAPTEGRVEVNGRLAPLLRLGVGFDRELTGRENVYMNGMILGMTEREIASRFDGIVAFAELEDFIDTPVKFYSSGMLVRLGFASAVSASPDLLIVDEVLAVGDIAFQTRSFDRMLEMREQGATLVVVSHNMQAVRVLADSAIVLNEGEVVFRGGTSDAISKYHEVQQRVVSSAEHLSVDRDAVAIDTFEMLDENGSPTAYVESGQTTTFVMTARFNGKVEQAVIGIAILTESAQMVYAENSASDESLEFDVGSEGTFTIRVLMGLVSGSYTAVAGITWGRTVKTQVVGPPKAFYVAGRPLIHGVADLRATFGVTAPPPVEERRVSERREQL